MTLHAVTASAASPDRLKSVNLANRPLAGEVTNSSCSNTTNGLITLENDHLELQTIKAQKSSVHDRNDDQGDIGSAGELRMI